MLINIIPAKTTDRFIFKFIETFMADSICTSATDDKILNFSIYAYITPPPVFQSNVFGEVLKDINAGKSQ